MEDEMPDYPDWPSPGGLHPEVFKIIAAKAARRDSFVAQYLAETGASIQDIEIVEEVSRDGMTTTFWCRPKTATAESFREFFVRRNGIAFPAVQHETTKDVIMRLADTAADWMDELAKRTPPAR